VSELLDAILYHRPIPDRELVALNMEAEDRVLADVDSSSDWLAGECYHAPKERIGYVPNSLTNRERFIESLTIAQLWRHAMARCVDDQTVLLAVREIQRRFLAASQDAIAKVQGDLQ
jgi:hypothetical protein